MDTVEEKKPQTYPKFAQDGPVRHPVILLPNGSICMIFNASKERRSRAGQKDWDEVQDIVVKGVDHFAGFFPFEGRSLGDWNKKRQEGRAEGPQAPGQVRAREGRRGTRGDHREHHEDGAREPVARQARERDHHDPQEPRRQGQGRLPDRRRNRDAPVPEGLHPRSESIHIEFPDRQLLEEISEGIKNVSALESKLEMMETRMFEIEKIRTASRGIGQRRTM